MRVLRAGAGEVLGLAFSPDARALAAAVEGRGVFLWNLDAGGPPVCLNPSASRRAKDLYFTADGRGVGWLDWDGWKVYDRDTRRVNRPRLSDPGQIFLLIPGPGGDRVYTQHSFPELALVGWRAAGGGWEREWEVPTRQLAVDRLAVAPGGDTLAVLTRSAADPKWGDKRPVLELRSAVNGRVVASAPYPWKCTGPLVVAPDGKHVVGLHQMTVVVWAAGDPGGPTQIRDASRKHFTAAAFDPSGRYLFAARFDATVHVFDAAGWGCRVRFDWGIGPLRAVAVSRDGTLAAAGGDRGEVVVWDVDLD
ncbi:MAG TPA: WD40 repeat domain-containing protein [Urbifossiella sp.]|jgi:WD40 repeat protein|nr:WD40 repeat domain-containing protein [Urbifossiella sp.]